MAPPFISRMRDRGLPPVPPEENPWEKAAEEYRGLRDYAEKVLRIAEDTNETNQILAAQNSSLQAEVERLSAQLETVMRDNRFVRSYAEDLRTRLIVISESIEVAKRESLQYASREVRDRQSDPEETAGASEVVASITRINQHPEPIQHPQTIQGHRTAVLPVNQYKR